jgi:hypothetical protein
MRKAEKEEGKAETNILAVSENGESTIKWLEKEVEDGENSILVYPDLQSFRQIYTRYVKDQMAIEEKEKEDEHTDTNNNTLSKQKPKSRSRTILIATFYETIDSVKHHFSAVGVKDVETLIDNGSLVIIDVFQAYHPDIDGMKKPVASLSERARKEGRAGVTAIVDMGYFFLSGGDGFATQLIKYEATLHQKQKVAISKVLIAIILETMRLLLRVREKSLLLKDRKRCSKSKKKLTEVSFKALVDQALNMHKLFVEQ